MRFERLTKPLTLGIAVLFFWASSALSQSAPTLGQAESFGVLGATAVTNTGASVITGDLGISPNDVSSISGFPPGILTGTLHAADALALGAQNDANSAYVSLAGEPCTLDLSGSDLGGLTLTPGVYCFSTSAQLTGTLTLDAQSNPNAVFIFQLGSTLTTASNSAVNLINGGPNCNVFWQVGSSATFGTTTNFIGNILAQTNITLNTGAQLSGRAIALTGAVTLASNAITLCPLGPLPCPSITLDPAIVPIGVVGSTYGPEAISASGGVAPYTFLLTSGMLPDGLSLSNPQADTIDITGTPTLPGSFIFTITATDNNACQGSQTYTMPLLSQPPRGIPTLSGPGLVLLSLLLLVLGAAFIAPQRHT